MRLAGFIATLVLIFSASHWHFFDLAIGSLVLLLAFFISGQLAKILESNERQTAALLSLAAWFSPLHKDKVAAENNDAEAQVRLGHAYRWGRGIPEDRIEAVRWYEKAAEEGNADAQDALGFLNYYGDGVPKSYGSAARWYCKAAEQGNVGAQLSLGKMYDEGKGMKRNYIEAYF